MNQFNDNFEDMESEFLEHQKREALEKSKSEFIKGCYEAYDVLATRGQEALLESNPKDIQKAINRMTQLFLMNEEYERCNFLKNYVDTHMPEFVITPDSSVIKELAL
jgi:hypothetical protein